MLWGLLDGMNDAGLAISLTRGGRSVYGRGFAILILVRYLLKTCDTVDAAAGRPFSLLGVGRGGGRRSGRCRAGRQEPCSQLRFADLA